MLSRRALTDFELVELEQCFQQAGLRAAQARQVLKWFYDHDGTLDLAAANLSRGIGRVVGVAGGPAAIALRQSTILARHDSADGTAKLLLGFAGGGAAEAVLMPTHRADRAAGCVSSQMGCAMGCDFCASTQGGLERDLSAGEIVEQFLHLRALARAAGRRLATVVFMGMGEPMLNLDNVIAAIGRIAAPGMGHLGGRQVTVSTVGIVPGILRLADAGLNVHLALSLHAPDDATRSRLIPANRRFGVREIIDAARAFQERTGRVVNIEYCMLGGINDSDEHAAALAEVMKGFRAHVNLIPYNSIGAGRSGQVYGPSTPQRVEAFLNLLRGRGVVAHTRVARGDDISAACGQLRALSRRATL